MVCGVLHLKDGIFICFNFVTLQNQSQNKTFWVFVKNKREVGIQWRSCFLGFAVSEVLVLKKEIFLRLVL